MGALIRLEDSRLASDPGYKQVLNLRPENGYVVQEFVPGFPEVRDNSDKRPRQNGTYDVTQFFGARPVVMMVALVSEMIPVTSDRYGMTDADLDTELRGWCLPALRPWLVWSRDGGEDRRMSVRISNVTAPIDLRTNKFKVLTISWRAPDGIVERYEKEEETLYPGGTGSEAGRSYDMTFDRSYPASDPIGVKHVVNSGTAPVYPVVTLFGPMTQARIENQTTGKKMELLSGYTISSGEYLVLDMNEGTAYLNGDPTNSKYDKIDFSVSDWWELVPGINDLRLYPGSSSSPASALVEYRSAYI